MKLLGITLRCADVAFGGNGGQAEGNFAFFEFETLAVSVVLFTLFFGIFFSFITGKYLYFRGEIETFVHIFRDQTGQRNDGKDLKK